MGGATGARAPQSVQRGAFILFEGVDRCGKTTQSRRLVEHLQATGVCALRMGSLRQAFTLTTLTVVLLAAQDLVVYADLASSVRT